MRNRYFCTGILHMRWGVLWRPLDIGVKWRAPMVTALINLHNFLIDENEEKLTDPIVRGAAFAPPPMDTHGRLACRSRLRIDADGLETAGAASAVRDEHARLAQLMKRNQPFTTDSRRKALRQAVHDAGIVRPKSRRSRKAKK